MILLCFNAISIKPLSLLSFKFFGVNSLLNMKRLYQILIIPLIAFYWVAITEIFHLISQPSDRDVVLGVIGLSALVALTIFLINKYQNNQTNEKN